MQKPLALVTGASRGVGKEVALHLAKKGYFIALVARNSAALSEVHDQIMLSNGEAVFFEVDVSNYSQVKTCVNNIVHEYGHINLLFNNAAILNRGTTDVSDEEIESLIKINLNGAIFMAKYVAQHMKQKKQGYIMNVGSLGGKVALSFSGVYAASKFGLSGFSEALSKEMAAYQVKVTNICPSMIATDMAKGRKFHLDQMIQVEDIIKTVDYLLSLSKNAIPTELLISCLPLIEKTAGMMQSLYLE